MDKKEIAEVKKLFGKHHCAVDRIAGCFAGEDRAIIADLHETFLALPEEETGKYCELFKKALSGKAGKNLFNLEFPLKEEEEGGKQAFLYKLLKSELKDEGLVKEYCGKILENLDSAGRHLVLVAHGNYDIPKRTSDGEEMEDASEYVYSFLLTVICPVEEVNEGLCYDALNMTFINKRSDLGVLMPAVGFLYPAFNDRMPDIHSCLYYAKKEDERHTELMDGMIGSDLPITESAQQELFTDLIEETLGTECTFEHVKNVTESLGRMMKEEEDSEEEKTLGHTEVERIVRECGLDTDHPGLADFQEKFEEKIGEGGSFHAENLANTSSLRIKAPSVSITVKAEMAEMITTRIIDGREFILIPLQDDTELNGIRILQKRRTDEE